ncbi:uncharacterized protein [Clytia hemisphaerica]|uniref:uncharacterized protein n=1 Tax=Clytia hemisphaerica TaxID=252671 RepID=UPI0034D674F5
MADKSAAPKVNSDATESSNIKGIVAETDPKVQEEGRRTYSKHKKRQRSPSSSSSESSSSDTNSTSSSSSEERRRRKRKKKSKNKRRRRSKSPTKSPEREQPLLFQMKEDGSDWMLEQRLAQYLNGHITKYISDKDISSMVLEEIPVPSNVSNTLKMDTLTDTLLKEKGYMGTKTLAVDKSISRISSKIRDILAPLASIWQNIEETRTGEDCEKIDLEEIAKRFQQAILLVGQAINATNFFRRKNALTALGIKESEVSSWLRETLVDDLENSDGKLFGEKMWKTLTKQSKAAGYTYLKQYLFSRRLQDQKRKPFSWGSSQTSRGEERQHPPAEGQGSNNRHPSNKKWRGNLNGPPRRGYYRGRGRRGK